MKNEDMVAKRNSGQAIETSGAGHGSRGGGEGDQVDEMHKIGSRESFVFSLIVH